MNTFTHLDIAKIVQQIVEEEFSIKLDTFAFRYGSIKPDISPALVKIPHYINDSIDFIKSRIEEMTYFKTDTFPNYTKQFSENLGIIIHYLADFFCYVHSAYYKGGTIEHYLYEMNLSIYYKIYLKRLRARRNSSFSPVCLNSWSICNYIDEQHIEYMKMEPSYETDMTFSLRICIFVCRSVILTSMAGELRRAA